MPASVVLVDQSEIVDWHGPLRRSRRGGAVSRFGAKDIADDAQAISVVIELLGAIEVGHTKCKY
ncbi:MAG TPA: hypothetical protein VFT08_03985 [Pyrinomonadaceae bacterium]|nr:hypothetical protein [Pyrinomonadaceae bacterium]